MNFEHPTCKGRSLIFIRYKMLLPLQGVNAMIIRVTQGVASLALGYVLLGFQPVLTKSENRYKLIFKTYLTKTFLRLN